MKRSLPCPVHCAIWLTVRHGVPSNASCTLWILGHFRAPVNLLRLLLDYSVSATPPVFSSHGRSSRIYWFCRKLHSHRVRCSRWCTDMVNRVSDRRCPRSFVYAEWIVEIWNDPLPGNEMEIMFFADLIWNVSGRLIFTCKHMTSGSFWIISWMMRYLRDSQVRASSGQQTKLSLFWPSAV